MVTRLVISTCLFLAFSQGNVFASGTGQSLVNDAASVLEAIRSGTFVAISSRADADNVYDFEYFQNGIGCSHSFSGDIPSFDNIIFRVPRHGVFSKYFEYDVEVKGKEISICYKYGITRKAESSETSCTTLKPSNGGYDWIDREGMAFGRIESIAKGDAIHGSEVCNPKFRAALKEVVASNQAEEEREALSVDAMSKWKEYSLRDKTIPEQVVNYATSSTIDGSAMKFWVADANKRCVLHPVGMAIPAFENKTIDIQTLNQTAFTVQEKYSTDLNSDIVVSGDGDMEFLSVGADVERMKKAWQLAFEECPGKRTAF